jgi:hypothetical protein
LVPMSDGPRQGLYETLGALGLTDGEAR